MPEQLLDKELVYPNLTDDQAREALARGDAETFKRWLNVERRKADEQPTSIGRFTLEVRYAQIQFHADERDDAIQHLKEVIGPLQEEIFTLYSQEHYTKTPEEEAKRAADTKALKDLYQQILYLLNEWREKR